MSNLKIELENLPLVKCTIFVTKHVILLDDEGNEIHFFTKRKPNSSDFSEKGDNVRAIIETVDFKGSKTSNYRF